MEYVRGAIGAFFIFTGFAVLASPSAAAEIRARECEITRVAGRYADVECREVALLLIDDNRCGGKARAGDKVDLMAIQGRTAYREANDKPCFDLIAGESLEVVP